MQDKIIIGKLLTALATGDAARAAGVMKDIEDPAAVLA